jgi:hypothetical protein
MPPGYEDLFNLWSKEPGRLHLVPRVRRDSTLRGDQARFDHPVRDFSDHEVVHCAGYRRDGCLSYWLCSKDPVVGDSWSRARCTDFLGVLCHHFRFYAVFDFRQDSQRKKKGEIDL